MIFGSTAATVLAASPVFSSPTNLSNDAFVAKEANVQNSGSNVYVTWTESSRGIYYRSSPDNGAAWTPPLSQSAMKLSLKGGTAQYPLMAVFGSNVYVVWSQTNRYATPLQVYFTESVNFGRDFSRPVVVDVTPSTASVTPVVATYGTNVYVAWSAGKASFVRGSSNNGTSSEPGRGNYQ